MAVEGPGVLAYLDLVGFSDMMGRVPSDALWEQLRIIQFQAEGARDYAPGALPSSEKVQGPQLRLLGDALIFFHLLDDEGTEAVEAVRLASNEVGAVMFHGWPVKAGVGFGKLLVSLDGHHVLGSSFAEAVKLERSQEWYGGALSESLIEHLQKKPEEWRKLLDEGYVVPWEVPGTRAAFALGWARGLPPQDTFSETWDQLLGKSAKHRRRKQASLEFFRAFHRISK